MTTGVECETSLNCLKFYIICHIRILSFVYHSMERVRVVNKMYSMVNFEINMSDWIIFLWICFLSYFMHMNKYHLYHHIVCWICFFLNQHEEFQGRIFCFCCVKVSFLNSVFYSVLVLSFFKSKQKQKIPTYCEIWCTKIQVLFLSGFCGSISWQQTYFHQNNFIKCT